MSSPKRNKPTRGTINQRKHIRDFETFGRRWKRIPPRFKQKTRFFKIDHQGLDHTYIITYRSIKDWTLATSGNKIRASFSGVILIMMITPLFQETILTVFHHIVN